MKKLITTIGILSTAVFAYAQTEVIAVGAQFNSNNAVEIGEEVSFSQPANSNDNSIADSIINQTLDYAHQAQVYAGYNFTNDFVYRGLSHNAWSEQVNGGFMTSALDVVNLSGDVLANLGHNGKSEIHTRIGLSKDFILYNRINTTVFAAYKNYQYDPSIRGDVDEIQAGIILDPTFYGIKGSVNFFREISVGTGEDRNQGVEFGLWKTFDINATDQIKFAITPYAQAGLSEIYTWYSFGISASAVVYEYKTIQIVPMTGVSGSFNDIRTAADPISFNVGCKVKF